MKKMLINGICLLIAVLSGVGLFVLKYQVKAQESVLKSIHQDILKSKREIHMLEAEWAHLNDPARLQKLVMEQTNWVSIQSQQLIQLDDIPLKNKGVEEVQQTQEEQTQPNTKKEAYVPHPSQPKAEQLKTPLNAQNFVKNQKTSLTTKKMQEKLAQIKKTPTPQKKRR